MTKKSLKKSSGDFFSSLLMMFYTYGREQSCVYFFLLQGKNYFIMKTLIHQLPRTITGKNIYLQKSQTKVMATLIILLVVLFFSFYFWDLFLVFGSLVMLRGYSGICYKIAPLGLGESYVCWSSNFSYSFSFIYLFWFIGIYLVGLKIYFWLCAPRLLLMGLRQTWVAKD